MGVVSKKANSTATTSLTSVTDEQFEGDEPLTPTDKMQDDVEDDDDLSALNSILQGGSPGTLSDEEHESASPLSSAPDDFPMSRSASPENSTRKRKSPAKSEKVEMKTATEESHKKRRVSRTTLEISENTRTLRRSSKHEDKQTPPKKSIEEKEEQVQEQDQDQDQEEEKEEEEEKKEDPDTEEKKPDGEPLLENGQVSEKPPTEPENAEDQEEEEDNETQDNNDHDYQQRHKEALDALASIEVEFARLRDKMYQEKMSELNEEAVMIANGTHPELVSLMAEIEEKKGNRIQNAEAWRKHQHANFKQQFEGFEYQANIHFISQKNALRRNLLNGLNGQKWSIEDERCKLNDSSREDPIYPDGRILNIHKKEQKEEIDELQDIKEAIGFPMAPNPNGLKSQDIDNDLKLLGLGR